MDLHGIGFVEGLLFLGIPLLIISLIYEKAKQASDIRKIRKHNAELNRQYEELRKARGEP